MSFSPSSQSPRRHGVVKENRRASKKVDSRDARINRRENKKKRKASSSQNSKKNKTTKTISKQGISPTGLAGAGTKMQANYSEDEDYLIACANVNVRVNSIKGVGQKSEAVWT